MGFFHVTFLFPLCHFFLCLLASLIVNGLTGHRLSPVFSHSYPLRPHHPSSSSLLVHIHEKPHSWASLPPYLIQYNRGAHTSPPPSSPSALSSSPPLPYGTPESSLSSPARHHSERLSTLPFSRFRDSRGAARYSLKRINGLPSAASSQHFPTFIRPTAGGVLSSSLLMPSYTTSLRASPSISTLSSVRLSSLSAWLIRKKYQSALFYPLPLRSSKKFTHRGFLSHSRHSCSASFSPSGAPCCQHRSLLHASAVATGRAGNAEKEEDGGASCILRESEIQAKTHDNGEESGDNLRHDERKKEGNNISETDKNDEGESEIECLGISVEELRDGRWEGEEANERRLESKDSTHNSQRSETSSSQSSVDRVTDRKSKNLSRKPANTQGPSSTSTPGISEDSPEPLPPRVYSSIPEIVAPPGRAYPFALPELSSRLTGIPTAAKPSKKSVSLSPSSSYASSAPRPSYTRLLPHYPRAESPPVDDGLLEEIFSATTREELHQSLEKLPHSVYIDWLMSPHRFRDSEGFLASTDPAELRERFADVYEHQQEQLRQRLSQLRAQRGRSVVLPPLSQEEKNRLLRLKIPAKFISQRPEKLEKQETPLKWKGGGLIADRELIDAGGPGGFVRNLEVEGWAALFPSYEGYEELTASSPEAARRRLEIATRMQTREWREDRRAGERLEEQLTRALEKRLQKEREKKKENADLQRRGKQEEEISRGDNLRDQQGEGFSEAMEPTTNVYGNLHPDLKQEEGVDEAMIDIEEDEAEKILGKKSFMSPNVQAAAEALIHQQLLANMGAPASVQALMARYGHITPDSPAMSMPDARSALQLLQRAVTDAEGFLLKRLHSALQHDPDVEAARTVIQEERERKAILGRPPPRSGHPTEFTPAMFQEWEENEMYKDVLSVAAEKTRSKLEEARRAFDWRRGTHREKAKEEDEEKDRGSCLRGQDAQEQDGKKEETKAAAGKSSLSDRQDDHEDGLPVPSKLLAGAAAAAKGGVGARALEAVRSIFREEMRKEFRRRETEQYRQMTAEMERNVKLSKGERESELMRQQEELSLMRRREEAERKMTEKETYGNLQSNSYVCGGKKPVPGSQAKTETVDRANEENVQETSQSLEKAAEGATTAGELETVPSVSREGRKTSSLSSIKQTEARQVGENEVTSTGGIQSEGQIQKNEGTKTTAGKVNEGLPTHEDEVVRRLRELSLGLAEASDVYRVSRKGDGCELRKENKVLLDTKEKDLKRQPSDVFVPLNTGDTEAGDDTSSPPHLKDIFDEMEEAMRAEWKRHLGVPFLRIYPGQLVKGEVVKVTPSFAYIHVGYKCEGEVRLDEVLLEDEEPPKKGLKAFFSVGDEIFSEVIKVSDDELILSLQTLRRIAAWEKLLALQRKDRALRATVLHVHRGGLGVRVLGLRGFLPISQLPSSVKPGPQLVGAQLPVVLLQADVERQRLVVSSRLVYIREQMKRLKPDQVVEGQVVSLHPFGVMVQFGECRGLLHLSEISAARVDRLDELLPVGSRVRALVLNYDRPTGKVALTTKLLERYPGEMVRDPLSVFAAASHTAATYATRKKEEKEARHRAAQQLIAALGLDPTSAAMASEEGRGPAGEEAEQQQLDTDFARSYGAEGETAPTTALWQGMGDDSQVMALLSRKVLERAEEKRRRLGGGSKSRPFGDQRDYFGDLGNQEEVSGIEMMRTERQRVIEAVKASGIELRGAWEVPSAFEAEWQTEEWLFDE
ncbi:30s ribosomal protein s1 [Cystoisospora suis]|uniref:30s ribosomal protein s1 n=1 Tax=Cystoisospora suis TaxID=483139 RepID=A0A2C6KQB5_9APIC|nr:30s ribosomal protein s1 [Cystoisospora suis]